MERKEGLSTKGWFRRLKAVNLGFFEGFFGGALQINLKDDYPQFCQ
jgi:hypothetical protein